ncbi:MAG: hypothetical protein KIT80_01625 [Chitinophagaceae bacterium]|nr:hypothetical protein [Chitinophagaceae bacterium]MCW5925586.1 hypothetical protein [Chitinophagaceae bacterium]
MKMDPIWSVFLEGDMSHTTFLKQLIPKLDLRSEVHTDIKENFRVVMKLLEHSYYEYRFYDVAVLKSVLLLEMALKIRYREVNNKQWNPKKSLKDLIYWFYERKFLEVYNQKYLDSLISIRNHAMHPAELTIHGTTAEPVLKNIINLINGLYEGAELREERMDRTVKIGAAIKEIGDDLICILKEKRILCYRIWMSFFNNKSQPHQFHFYIKPIVELPEDQSSKEWGILPHIHIIANDVILHPQKIILKTNSDDVIIQPVEQQEEVDELKKWKDKHGKLAFSLAQYICVNNQITDPFGIHLRDFNQE